MTQNWYKSFNDSDLSLEIKPRSGQPSITMLKNIKQKRTQSLALKNFQKSSNH